MSLSHQILWFKILRQSSQALHGTLSHPNNQRMHVAPPYKTCYKYLHHHHLSQIHRPRPVLLDRNKCTTPWIRWTWDSQDQEENCGTNHRDQMRWGRRNVLETHYLTTLLERGRRWAHGISSLGEGIKILDPWLLWIKENIITIKLFNLTKFGYNIAWHVSKHL